VSRPPRLGVHQFVQELLPHDAIGGHTLLLRDALRREGWRSEIFVETPHAETAADTLPYAAYPAYAADAAEPGNVLVFQFSFSAGLSDFLAARPEPLVLSFHNVTPPELWNGWDEGITEGLTAAYGQLRRLAPRVALGLAVSRFNERELRSLGYLSTAVAPLLVDMARLDVTPDPTVAVRLARAKREGGADWLFVGRVAPSKAVEDLVKALWAYRRLYDPLARLHVVGPFPSLRYRDALGGLAEDLGLADAVRLLGEVPDAALAAFYAAADVYVSTSRHEGVGVPLLEAMRAGVPVVALAAAGVPETVGGAGILVDRPAPSYLAAAVHRVLDDASLRARLVEGGRARAGEHAPDVAARHAVDVIASVAGIPACA
jgi:glycosyltransferase involved in cell wall biosynthesis